MSEKIEHRNAQTELDEQEPGAPSAKVSPAVVIEAKSDAAVLPKEQQKDDPRKELNSLKQDAALLRGSKGNVAISISPQIKDKVKPLVKSQPHSAPVLVLNA